MNDFLCVFFQGVAAILIGCQLVAMVAMAFDW